MIKRTIDSSLNNRFIILLMMAAIFMGGMHAIRNITLDAIPDLSDVQVIILTEYPGQAPRIVEDQVTYPITTKMLAVPHASVVRGYSFYNYSFVYVLFEDGTDIYWARSRVLEYLSQLQGQLPDGVSPQLGPDATGVGWAYQYVLTSDRRDLAQLRSLQDWFLKYELTAVDGVAEVATIGGFQRQCQVTIDPEKLRAYDLSITQVREAIRRSNNEVGGRTIEMAETDYMLRGLGYLGTLSEAERREAEASGISIDIVRMNRTVEELEAVALGVRDDGTPILLRDVGRVGVGPEMRRGILEWNGEGEAVGGIVVVRHGADTLETIARVEARLAEIRKSLPEDVEIHVGYDRTALIERSIDTLKRTLIEESIIVSVIIMLFLLHFRSALVPVLTLPLAVLMSFIIMHFQGLGANIMSLGGIAIAIGAMVDASIIVVENVHKHFESDRRGRGHWEIVREACLEVGPTLFFALLVITVSFMPIFTLEAQEGRMFKPLAFTKTYAMAASAFLAITVSPVLAGYFIRREMIPAAWDRRRRVAAFALTPPLVFLLVWLGTKQARLATADAWLGLSPALWIALGIAVATLLALIPQAMHPEERNPISRALVNGYRPLLAALLRSRAAAWGVVIVALAITSSLIIPYRKLGREFMPPLYEGDLLYMPTTLPGISATKARELIQQTDRIIAAFPEVESVYGKVGRAESATDPAPMTMIETTIRLKPESEWPVVDIVDQHDQVLAHRRRTPDELIDALNREVRLPGLTNAWTMPIKTRIDMLSTGIKTPVGIKIAGPDLRTLERIGEQVEAVVRAVPGTQSVYAERVMGDRYVNFEPDREAIQRYGLTVGDVQDVFMTAIGGMAIAETIEGLERYPINLRYPREMRDNIDELRRVLVPTPQGYQIPLGDLGRFVVESGPAEIKSEQGRPNAWVYVDIEGDDVGGYVERARAEVGAAIADGRIALPAGYALQWSGQYEYMVRARERLAAIVPVTLLIILVLIYLSTRSAFQTFVVMACLPTSLLGAFWFLYLLDYNLSVAVWVGIIALAGLDAETSQVMLLYLDLAWERLRGSGRPIDVAAVRAAVLEGAAVRLRPKAMTVGSTMVGLLPILWATGAGADTMKRIAVPMIGGMVSSFVMEMLLIPAVYFLWRSRGLKASASGQGE